MRGEKRGSNLCRPSPRERRAQVLKTETTPIPSGVDRDTERPRDCLHGCLFEVIGTNDGGALFGDLVEETPHQALVLTLQIRLLRGRDDLDRLDRGDVLIGEVLGASSPSSAMIGPDAPADGQKPRMEGPPRIPCAGRVERGEPMVHSKKHLLQRVVPVSRTHSMRVQREHDEARFARHHVFQRQPFIGERNRRLNDRARHGVIAEHHRATQHGEGGRIDGCGRAFSGARKKAHGSGRAAPYRPLALRFREDRAYIPESCSAGGGDYHWEFEDAFSKGGDAEEVSDCRRR